MASDENNKYPGKLEELKDSIGEFVVKHLSYHTDELEKEGIVIIFELNGDDLIITKM